MFITYNMYKNKGKTGNKLSKKSIRNKSLAKNCKLFSHPACNVHKFKIFVKNLFKKRKGKIVCSCKGRIEHHILQATKPLS